MTHPIRTAHLWIAAGAVLTAATAAAQSATPDELPGTDPQPAPPPIDASLSWADWSGDGLVDAWAAQPDGTGLLLENLGDGTFADRTQSAGLDDVRDTHAAAWADVDGDGRLDLYLASWNGASRLFVQPNTGAFVDVTRACGLSPHARPVNAEWVDYDADGRPDLHLVTQRGDVVYRGLGRARFEEVDLGLVPRSGLPGATAMSTAVRPPGTSSLGTGVSSTALPPSAGAGAASGICAGSIEDQATGSCIQASSAPTLGLLYPLSNDFFVDGAGNVGIGTIAPAERLEVNGAVRAFHFRSTAATGTAPFEVASSTRVDNLNADQLDGLDATDFRLASASITSADVQNESLRGADIFDGSLTGADIADGTITSADIRTSGVTTVEILNSTITSIDVADGALTGADIAAGSISGVEIAPNSIGGGNIMDGSIGSPDLALGAIGSAQIFDGAIVDADVSPAAAIAGTKVDPDFGTQTITSQAIDTTSPLAVGATASRGAIGQLGAYGVMGASALDDYQGVTSADWNGLDLGVAGLSVGSSTTDNYGVIGHSNNVGVRGENASNPQLNYTELGLNGIGLRASGTIAAADLLGRVDIQNAGTGLAIAAGSATEDAMLVDNPSEGRAATFTKSAQGSLDFEPCVTMSTGSRGPTLSLTQSGANGWRPCLDIRATSTVNIGSNTGLRVIHEGTGSAAQFEVDSGSSEEVMYVFNSGSGDGILTFAQDGDGLGAHSDDGAGVYAQSRRGRAVDANTVENVGNILVARNIADIEFRVESSGRVYCDETFIGGGADYAEWLPKLDATETFAKGDVVGVFGGRISKDLDGAESILVISSNPVLVGNALDAESGTREDHEIVGFLGQVPVRVRGTVRSGDLLIPSGKNDGTAIAVTPEALRPSQLADVIGRAWDDARGAGVHSVNAAIGLERDRIAALALGAVQGEVDGLRTELDAVEGEVEDLRAQLDAVLARLESLEQR